MVRTRRLVAVVAGLILFGASTLPASADTGGTGGGTGGGSGGGLSGGGGSGSGGVNASGDCGPGRILAFFDENVWNAHPTPYPTGAAITPYVYPTYKNFSTQMVFLFDVNTGKVWGPPGLEGYNASTGEGFPPGYGSTFAVHSIDNNTPSGFYPDYACYDGGPPDFTPNAPTQQAFNLATPSNTLKTETDHPKAGLVLDKIHAIPQTVCPSNGPIPGPIPAASDPASIKTNNPPPGCPEGGVQHGTDATNAWDVVIYAVPIDYNGDNGACDSGSGTWEATFKPGANTWNTGTQSYGTGSYTICSSSLSGLWQQYYHVLPPNPGLTVRITKKWAYHCWGWATLTTGSGTDAWSFNNSPNNTVPAGSFPMGSDTAGSKSTKLTQPDGTWFQVTCDAGYRQTYQILAPPIPIDQIEPVANG